MGLYPNFSRGEELTNHLLDPMKLENDVVASLSSEQKYSGCVIHADIDDCPPDPCQPGWVCVDGLNNYTCACPAGYSGINCDIG